MERYFSATQKGRGRIPGSGRSTEAGPEMRERRIQGTSHRRVMMDPWVFAV